jgi:hypothetical protein
MSWEIADSGGPTGEEKLERLRGTFQAYGLPTRVRGSLLTLESAREIARHSPMQDSVRITVGRAIKNVLRGS